MLFIARPREEPQLASCRETAVGAAASIVNMEGSCVCVCVWGENQRLWCKALSASSLYPLPLLRLEFISLLPFVSRSGKTSLGNSLDYPIIFLLHCDWGEWLKYPFFFFFFFPLLPRRHNGLTVSSCRPWTPWCFHPVSASFSYNSLKTIKFMSKTFAVSLGHRVCKHPSVVSLFLFYF